LSNTQRPSLQRKHTRTTKANKAEALDTGMTVVMPDGPRHTVRLGDVTPQIARELRAAIGTGVLGLMEQLGSKDADLDLVQAFIFVARRIAGEAVTLDDCEVTYADMLSDDFDVVVAGAEEPDGSDPEA